MLVWFKKEAPNSWVSLYFGMLLFFKTLSAGHGTWVQLVGAGLCCRSRRLTNSLQERGGRVAYPALLDGPLVGQCMYGAPVCQISLDQ